MSVSGTDSERATGPRDSRTRTERDAVVAAPASARSRPSPRSGLRRLVVHDFCGHPFPVQLSREFAARGVDVLHLHCPSYLSGKGSLERSVDDPATLVVDDVRLSADFDKYSLWRRPLQEREYGRRLAARVQAFEPDVVLAAQTPLLALRILVRACRTSNIPFVLWEQDLYSLPIRDALRQRVPLVGGMLGRVITHIEANSARSSDAVIAISEDFEPQLLHWGVPRQRLHVVENWAPLDELPVLPKDNAWAREHGLEDKRVLLYSGTLGIKHNPELLLDLARHYRDASDVRVLVISEGFGADALSRASTAESLPNLIVLGFQPYARLPEVLATADVLVAILEPDAGVFAVPSKVLTYLCAGRPILAAMPAENLAAKTIVRSASGVVVDPRDPSAFKAAADSALEDGADRGGRARAYAESTFEISRIADRFEEILDRCSIAGIKQAVPDRRGNGWAA